MQSLKQISTLLSHFSPWYSWNDTTSFDDYAFPGVYAIAHFTGPMPDIADPSAREVVYIGETCNRYLGKRLAEFDNSGFKKRDGHSGGHTYFSRFCESPQPIYFTMLAFRDQNRHQVTYQIRCLERLLLWDYFFRHGEPPCCNSK